MKHNLNIGTDPRDPKKDKDKDGDTDSLEGNGIVA